MSAKTVLAGVASTIGAALSRFDGWENTLSGLGGADNNRAGANKFNPANKLAESELKDLYDGNWLARRVVDAVPNRALRKPVIAEQEVLDAFNKINTDNRYPSGVLKFASSMGRLCGGAVIVLGVMGSGSPLASPIPIDPETKLPKISSGSVAFLEVLTKFDLDSISTYNVPADPTLHGRTEIFKVKNGRLKDLLIHSSRMIFVEGAARARQGTSQIDIDFPWQSVLQPVHEVLGSYGISWSAVSHLVQESSMAWLRLKGLTDMLTTEDKALVQERMNLMSVGRNVSRTVFLDAGTDKENAEEFGRTAVSFSDLPAVMKEFALFMSGAADIPATVLFGMAPAGLNATGESDMRQWYDQLTEWTMSSAKPKIDVLLAAAGKPGAEYSFPPLWEPTASEAADIRTKLVEGDFKLWTMGVVEPNHVLESRGKDKTLGLTFDFEKELAERSKEKSGPTIQITPTDNAKAITLNEIRANQGKGPLPDPLANEPMFVYELAKTKEIEAKFAAATQPTTPAPGAPPQEGGAAGSAPPKLPKQDDFDPDQPRDEQGQWTAAGGAAINSHKDKAAVQQFLNVERRVSSELQVHGFDHVAQKYGEVRAKAALRVTQGANKALKDAAKAVGATRVVYRGQTVGQGGEEGGRTVANKNIWSASVDRDATLGFAAKGERPVLYEITTRSAVPVDAVEDSVTFGESLIPSGTRFSIAGVREVVHNNKAVKVVSLVDKQQLDGAEHVEDEDVLELGAVERGYLAADGEE